MFLRYVYNIVLLIGNKEYINPSVRKNFTPVTNSKPCIEDIFHAMYSSSSNACAFQYVDLPAPHVQAPESDLNVATEVETETDMVLPPSLHSTMLAQDVATHKDVPQMLPDEIQAIDTATVEQHKSDLWKEHRRARITASNIHAVKTRMKTINSNTSVSHDITSLVNRICPKSNIDEPAMPAMKYGVATEGEAIEAFRKKLTKDGHTNVNIKQCGLRVHQQHQYIAASPDGIVTCSCCSDRVLEVKCPLRCLGKNPNSVQLPYLSLTTGVPKLKTTHEYYDQIITQMAVTGMDHGEFIIYSKKGIFHQTIKYNHVAFNALVHASRQFFDEYVVPYYQKERLKVAQADTITACSVRSEDKHNEEQENMYFVQDIDNDINVHGDIEIQTSIPRYEELTANGSKKRHRKRRTIVESLPIYMCGVCELECFQPDDIMSCKDFSVQCDNCKLWYHQVCVNYSSEVTWNCSKCAFTF